MVPVTLLQNEVVCLTDLFWGGMEGEPGIGKARFGEGGVGTIFVARFFSLGIGDVGGNGCALRAIGGRHVDEIINFSL